MKTRLIAFLLIIITLLGTFAAADPLTEEDRYADVDEGVLTLIDRINGDQTPWSFEPNADLLHVYFPRIYDADAALILCGGEAVLIDCASEFHSKALVAMLKDLGITYLDRVFLSHPHHDHINGIEYVAKVAGIGSIGICFNEDYNFRMRHMLALMKPYHIPIEHYDDGDVFDIGWATLSVLKKVPADMTVNEQSPIMRLSLDNRSILFCADIEDRAFAYYTSMEDTSLLAADIIKYPHHGVERVSDEFLTCVSPSLAIITNTVRANHTIEWLAENGVSSAMTVPNGVHLVTDGEVWIAEPYIVGK